MAVEHQRAIKEQAAEAHYRIGVLSNKLGNTEDTVQEFRPLFRLTLTIEKHEVAEFYT